MPTLTTILTIFFIPVIGWIASTAYAIARNYLQARKLGIPLVVIPFSWQNGLWIVALRWLRHFSNVPGLHNILTYGGHAWPQDERYRPHQEYGDVFAVVSPTKTEIIVNDPVVGHDVQAQYKTWLKPGDVYDIFETFGPNVITLNGEAWQRHRRIVNPAFREPNNKLVWDESARQARQWTGSLADTKNGAKPKTMLEVRDECVLIALHILSAAGFGHLHDFDGGLRDVPEGHSTSLAEALKFLLQNILFDLLFRELPILHWVFPDMGKKLTNMAHEFRQYMKELITYNRAISQGGRNSGPAADIMSALVEADEVSKRENKNSASGLQMNLTDDELMGDLYIFNMAGFETTANALTYTIPFLAVNREIQDWVGAEVDAVLKGQDPQKPNYEETFPNFVRCMALMYETLRLWGPVPSIQRVCVGEPQILRVGDKEVAIPSDAYLTLNYYAINSDPRWWGKDSLEWRPQRWVATDPGTGKETLRSPSNAAFTPWSVGPRVCPGKKFSQVEFVAVISTLLKDYRLKPLAVGGDQTEAQARKALMEVVEDSMNTITPKMRRPEDAGVVFMKR